MKKIKTGTMLLPKTIKMCDDNLKLANVKSRNDFIEKAILFYVSYLNSSNNEYINDILDKTLDSKFSLLEDRISQTLFKQSVEINMLNHIVATISELNQETINLLRKKSIQEVKETSGNISLDDVIKNSDDTD